MRGATTSGWAIAASVVLHAGALWAVHQVASPAPRAIPVVLRVVARPAPPRPQPPRPKVARPEAPRLRKQPAPPPETRTWRPSPASASVPVAPSAVAALPEGLPETRVATASDPIGVAEATSSAIAEVQEVVGTSPERYMAEILALIEAHVDYPLQARRMLWAGKSLVHCTVARDGLVQGVAVETSCGYRLLDEAAMRAIRRAGRFPPLPEAIAGDQVTLKIPVTFRLEN